MARMCLGSVMRCAIVLVVSRSCSAIYQDNEAGNRAPITGNCSSEQQTARSLVQVAQGRKAASLFVSPSKLVAHEAEGSCGCKIARGSGLVHNPPGAVNDDGSDEVAKLPLCFMETGTASHRMIDKEAERAPNCSCAKWSNFTPEQIVAECWPRENEQAIYVVGDSHSSVFAAALRSVTNIPTHALQWYWGVGPDYHPNSLAALNLILKQGDVVVYAQYAHIAPTKKLRKFLEDLASITNSRKAKLLLVGDNPQMQDKPDACIGNKDVDECSSNITIRDDLRPAQAEMNKFLKRPGTYFFDTYDFFCNAQGLCPIFIPGTRTVAYKDEHHLNDNGAFYLAPFVCSFFQKADIAHTALSWPAGAWR